MRRKPPAIPVHKHIGVGTDAVLKLIEILDAAHDQFGPFIAARFSYGTQSVEFRWGIDDFTCDQLRRAMAQAKNSLGDGGRFRLSLLAGEYNAVDDQYYAAFTYILGTAKQTYTFLCTGQFIANLKWLKERARIDELKELALARSSGEEIATTDELNLAIDMTDEQQPGTDTDRATRSPWTYMLLAGCLIFILLLLPHANAVPQFKFSVGSQSRSHSATANGDAVPPSHLEESGGASAHEEIPEFTGESGNEAPFNPAADESAQYGNDSLQEEPHDERSNGVQGSPTQERVDREGSTDERRTADNDQVIADQCDRPGDDGASSEKALRVLRSSPGGYVALTFDDGPSPYTAQIVDVLDAFQVKATFFFVGSQIAKHPEMVKYVWDRGHAIGNHSWSHRDLTHLTRKELEQEIFSVAVKIQELTGAQPELFRPPYGRWNDSIASILRDNGLTLALWNRDPRDWEATSSKQIVDAVLNDAPSGGVFVLHESMRTLEALPHILESFAERQLEGVAMAGNVEAECY